jgi:hypothetical protein
MFSFILFVIHFYMIECNHDLMIYLFVMYDVQYAVTIYGSKINCIYICICKPQMNITCIKCIHFYVFKSFLKNAILLIFSSNLIYMYFHQGSKNLKI